MIVPVELLEQGLIGKRVVTTNPTCWIGDGFLWSPCNWTEMGYGALEVVALGAYIPQQYASPPILYAVLDTPRGMRNVRLSDLGLSA